MSTAYVGDYRVSVGYAFDMDTIGTRIKFARKLRGMTQQDIASHFKISRVSVAQWEGRGNSPEPDKIPELARLLSTTTNWLISREGKDPAEDDIVEYERVPLDEPWTPSPDAEGEGYNRESYKPKIPGAIPELDAKAGAGEGAVGEVMVLPVGADTISAHKIIDEWYLPASYLREAVRNPNQAIVMAIDGDSMTPNYSPGDRVIIDLSQDRFEADGVYLISYDYRPPQVKRLQAVPLTVPHRVAVMSDNQLYKSFEVELDLIRIHGKVCAYVGRR